MFRGAVIQESEPAAGGLPPVLAPVEADRPAASPFLPEARVEGLLLVELEAPRPAVRGRLALFIEGSIERALESIGAPPPGVGASADLDASVSDQLYRARRSGKQGLALSFATLAGVSNLAGALDAEDSAVLRWWLQASKERPVRLHFNPADSFLKIYAEPTPLGALVDGDETVSPAAPAAPTSPDVPAMAPEVAASAAAMALTAEGPMRPPEPEPGELPAPLDAEPVTAHDTAGEGDALLESQPAEQPDVISETARAMTELFDADERDGWLCQALLQMSTPPPADATTELPEALTAPHAPEMGDHTAAGAASSEAESVEQAIGEESAPDEMEPSECADEAAAEAESTEPEETVVEPDEDVHTAAAEDPRVEAEAEPEPVPAEPEPVAVRDEGGPNLEELRRRCRSWMRELEAAHGPKPLAVVERLFVSAYVPLRDAVARGYADPEARRVLDEWSTAFERSYSEAFDALRVRGKRPTMVLDVPDLALRIGRLHGARGVQLLLVDGMRFDVGLRIHDRLKERIAQSAACAETLLLWSALPATTATQLELIGRGPGGLREFTGEVDEEMLVARGRKASTIRRLKTGHREVMKLDMVEARMSEPGGPESERLDGIADEVAERLSAYIGGVPERTLVLVFGDHGFLLDARDGGTTAARQGGASPEEVLVPAFAWMVGSLH